MLLESLRQVLPFCWPKGSENCAMTSALGLAGDLGNKASRKSHFLAVTNSHIYAAGQCAGPTTPRFK